MGNRCDGGKCIPSRNLRCDMTMVTYADPNWICEFDIFEHQTKKTANPCENVFGKTIDRK